MTSSDAAIGRPATVSRVAVVTGGASGVGLSIAEHLVRAGHDIAVLDIDSGAAVSAARSLTSHGAAAGWGRIVTISSAAGQTASPRQAHYSASKGGVIAMTKTVAAEFARKGITATTVPPFTVDTPMLRSAQEAGYLPATEVLTGHIPAGRLGTVDDIGATVAFLCSEEAGYITGQVIAPNGGAVI